MKPEIELTLQELNGLDARLRRNLAKMPAERIAWSPSPEARNAIHLVVHCANSLEFIGQMLKGSPYPGETMAAADAEFRAAEAQFSSIEEALAHWESKLNGYIGVLHEISDWDFSQGVVLPFGMGEVPLSQLIRIGEMHTREHVAQLEYLQTCYGDRVW